MNRNVYYEHTYSKKTLSNSFFPVLNINWILKIIFFLSGSEHAGEGCELQAGRSSEEEGEHESALSRLRTEPDSKQRHRQGDSVLHPKQISFKLIEIYF